jgi:hypothetical protein
MWRENEGGLKGMLDCSQSADDERVCLTAIAAAAAAAPSPKAEKTSRTAQQPVNASNCDTPKSLQSPTERRRGDGGNYWIVDRD